MSMKRKSAIAGCTLSWLCVSAAFAQTSSPSPAQPTQPAQAAQPVQAQPMQQSVQGVQPAQDVQLTQPVPPMQSVRLTPEQLQAFSDLTGDGRKVIFERLATDQRLAPLVAAAAQARMSRRTTGKVLTILGFSILGVGDIVGSAIMMATPGYPRIKSDHEGQFFLGAGVDLVSLGVGLALAIPGLMKMIRPGDEENRILELYNQGRGPGAYQTTPGQTLESPQVVGKTVAAPVFSLAF